MEAEKPIPQPAPLKNHRTEDFAAAYSNNVMFETSVWDLKFIFGELDQAGGTVEQHTSITIPWSMAKLLLYLLRLQVVAHEIGYGKIPIADDVKPTEIQPPPENLKDNQTFQKIYEAMKKEREEFLKTI
jgi:hypothetical protein